MKSVIKNLICIFILSGFITYYLNVNFLANNNLDMIAVNAVLVGFLFTIYTILMSFTDEKVIITYEKTKELDRIYNNITEGIILGIFAIGVAILSLCIFGEPDKNNINFLNKIMYSSEIAMFVLLMKSMLVAIVDINSIVGAIRDRKRKIADEDKANEEMNKEFGN